MTTSTLNAFAPAHAFRRAIDLASRIVEKRSSIPVLSNVMMRASEAGAAIIGTCIGGDGEMQLTAHVRGAITDPGFAATFPAHLARDLARKATGDELEIRLRDKVAAFDFYDGALSELPVIGPEDFPDLGFRGEVTADLDFSADAFRAGLATVEHAISYEATRYYLNGVYLHTVFDDAGARVWRMVATDGHRMAVHDLAPTDLAGDHGVIIPTAAVKALLHMLRPEFEGTGKRKARVSPETVRVTLNCTRARFIFGDLELATKLVDGTFPDYQRVIPRGNGKRMTIDADAMADLLKRVTVNADRKMRAVKLEIEAGTVLASYHDGDGAKASDIAACEYDAEPLVIGFHREYVLQLLVQIEGPATWAFSDYTAPVLVRGGDPRTLFVLMPVQV